MEARRFVLVLFGLTALFCAALVAYNFFSMPPYGADAASLTPLYASSSLSVPKMSAAAESSSAASSAPAQSAAGKTAPRVSSAASSASSAPVDVNTATLAELEALPDIGPKKAQAILDYRAAHGRFASLDELGGVKGIGTKTLEKLRPYVTLG